MKLSTPKNPAEIEDFQDKKAVADFIYGTNQAIQNLRLSIDALRSLQADQVNRIGSDYKGLEIAFEKHTEASQAAIKQIKKYVDTLHIESFEQHDKVKNCLISFDKHLCSKADFENAVRLISDRLVEVDVSTRQLRGHFDSKLHELKEWLVKQLAQCKADLTAAIPPVDTSFVEQLAIVHNEFAALRKEIAYNKKDTFVATKNIENLYTIIGKIR